MSLELIAIALAPAIALAIYVYFRDTYEKEPFGVMAKSFLLGALSAIPAVLLGLALKGVLGIEGPSPNLLYTAIYTFVVVAFAEEVSKFFMVRVYAYRHRAFNEPFDGIVYAVMVSLGFAAIENIIYTVEGGLGTGLMRMFTAVPAHFIFGVILGSGMGMAKFSKEPTRYMARGILGATLLHGAYNFFLMQQLHGGLAFVAILGLLWGSRLSAKHIKAHLARSPFREIPEEERTAYSNYDTVPDDAESKG